MVSPECPKKLVIKYGVPGIIVRCGTGSDDDWEITYRFAASPNKTGLTVGDIGGISKKGWEYMWVRYADDVDDTAMALIKKPVAVYIEKVYDDAAFSGLGI